ncbi:MAG: hypothetical protein Q4B17_08290 [Lautropia sp.]|nr:hypothetical protein [Lautropia sp.]
MSKLPEGFLEVDTDEMRMMRTKRKIMTESRLMDQQLDQVSGRKDRWAMITTTYRPDEEWEPKQITRLVKAARHYVEKHGFVFRYIWVLEMTKRGRPHYHLAIKLPHGLKLPKPDQAGWWQHGMTRIEYVKYIVAYLAKYLSKVDSFEHYPKYARLTGSGGLPSEAKRESRLWMSPSYVREEFGESANPFRAEGGGWVNRETGEVMPSRYGLVWRSGRTVRLIDLWAGGKPPVTRSTAHGGHEPLHCQSIRPAVLQ